MTVDALPNIPTVLVVDDEPDMRDLARLILEIDGLVVLEAANGADALEQYSRLVAPIPDVVVLDNRMPGLSGLDVAEEMLSRNPGQVIVLFSAHLDRTFEAEARALGVAECLSKVDARRLPQVIRRLLTPA